MRLKIAKKKRLNLIEYIKNLLERIKEKVRFFMMLA